MENGSLWYTSISTRGSKVMLRYVEDGIHKSEVIEYKPELYIKTNDASKSDAMSMEGDHLETVQFNDNKEMRAFLENYKDINGFSVYGADKVHNQFVAKNFPGKINFDPNMIKCAIVDIEVFSGDIDENGEPIPGPFPKADEVEFPINLITVYNTLDRTFYEWGLEWFKGVHLGTYIHDPNHDRVGALNIVYEGFKDELSLLESFATDWKSQEYHAWSGWNIEGFDNPYIGGRIEKICGTPTLKKLSYWNMVNTKNVTDPFGNEGVEYDFVGVEMLDYMALFKKHGFMNPPDYKLQTVAELILGEGKVDYDEEGDLNSLYIRNYQKAVVYNVVDVNLIVQMNAKKKFLELSYMLAYMTKCNYRDTMATVIPWSSCSYSMLYDKGVRPKIKSVYQGNVNFGGGFVRDVVAGRYRWVVSTDLNSLYPHIIQQWNLGAETIVEPEDLPIEIRNMPQFTLDDLVNKRVDLSILKKYDLCMTANRQFFRRNQRSIFNTKTREIYGERKGVKGEMLGLEQELVNAKAEAKRRGLI